MGLMNFLGNEFIDVIEWLQNDDDTMVYRFPRYRNEIKYGAKLTVREGQTAIFVNEGKIADVFPPGIYELKTANLPLLSTLQHWDHGLESPFKAEVYFFNTTDFLNQKWGTKQPVMINDAQFGIVRLRAFGTYTLRISHVESLFKKLVGTDGNFEISEVSEQITNSIATCFPEVLATSKIGVMELPTRYSELAEELKQHLQSDCEQYGLSIGKIYVESVSLPEKVQKMLDEKTSMNILGDSINEYAQIQIAQGVSEGSHESSMVTAGVEMAMGAELGRQLTENKYSSNEPPPLAKNYYLMILGERIGPMAISDVYSYLNKGEADAHTLIWRKGMGEWQTIEDSNDIDLSHLPPPLPDSSEH